MNAQAIKQALRAFGITQAELARCAGLSEAAISRQLAGDLTLNDRVRDAAEALLVTRGAQVAGRILDWVELRRPALGRRNEGSGA